MIIQADARHIPLADESVQCVVTSPPYWGLRDYGLPPLVWDDPGGCEHEWGDPIIGRCQSGSSTLEGTPPGQERRPIWISACVRCKTAWRSSLGLEPTPELYVQHIVEIFREVRRVLRKDGTVWLNMGDSYGIGSRVGPRQTVCRGETVTNRGSLNQPLTEVKIGFQRPSSYISSRQENGLKPKDLCGLPWRVAFALQNEGWWLRSDIIWSKPSPMPESVTDRPTRAHEYLFLLSKSKCYYYDAEAIREASANKRSVWTIASEPYPEAHFATFPENLVKPCILAGSSETGCCVECGAPRGRIVEKSGGTTGKSWHNHENDLPMGQRQAHVLMSRGWKSGDYQVKTLAWQPTCKCGMKGTKPCMVLDPLVGSGTTVKVAQDLGRIGIGLDLKWDYLLMAKRRAAQQGISFAKDGRGFAGRDVQELAKLCLR